MKVSKKDESLARSLLMIHLFNNGFPEDRIDERVNEAWPGELQHAKDLNSIARSIQYDLVGHTTEEEIKRWSD
jgi:hypothetical protein